METIKDLMSRFPRDGRVDWIGIATESGGDIQSVQLVEVNEGTGIEGEHHAMGGNSKRQVTLIQSEHLDVVGKLLEEATIDPARVRRNIVVSGINLIALKEQEFRVGTVTLRGTGPCVPCSLMERKLGPGGYNAMRGHGGLCAVVVAGGIIRVGDRVVGPKES